MTDLNASAIAEYEPIEAGLAALREKYGAVVFDTTSTKGLEEAKAARSEVREPRYQIEAMRKTLKAPALAYGKRIDAEAARITAEILKIEQPIDEAVKAAELRKEAERAAREAAELARRQRIAGKIAAIRNAALVSSQAPSKDIDVTWNAVQDTPITETEFEEFFDEAVAARSEALAQLCKAFNEAGDREQEAIRLAAEKAELLRQRAELDAMRRVDEERRAAADAAAKAERDALEAAAKAVADAQSAELKAQRDELKRQQEEMARQQQALERQRLQAENDEADRIEAARLMQEGIDRAAREKALAEERARVEAERAAAAAEARRQRGERTPPLIELALVIAKHYDVDGDVAMRWITEAVSLESSAA